MILFICLLIALAASASAKGDCCSANNNSTAVQTTAQDKLVELNPCFQNPSDPSCADFTYPVELAVADMDNLCTAMKFMSGCSIRESCPQPGLDAYCKPVSYLADVCIADPPMTKMSGCKNYNALCSKTSAVKQCKNEVAIPKLVPTGVARDQIRDICDEMWMDDCATCPRMADPKSYPDCNILQTYSRLCMAMPDMHQCGEWKEMCKAIPDSDFCDVRASVYNSPSMRMYFHTGIMDYILFETWVPRDELAYALSCIAVFGLGFALEAIKIGGLHLEHYWIKADALRQTKKSPYTAKILFQQDIPRVFVTFFSQSLSYAVMLITMTYNYGIFVCTVMGIAVGAGALRRYLPMPKSEKDQVCCVEDCC